MKGRKKNKSWLSLVLIAFIIFSTFAPYLGGKVHAEELQTKDLIFSEYVEGTSYNKAIEIYNGTGVDVDLTGYTVELYSNGSNTPGNTQNLEGTLNNGDTLVMIHSSADAALQSIADMASSVVNFNGDDALVLKKDGVIIDSFGQVGVDPGSAWGSGDYSTVNHTLVRNPNIMEGDSIADDEFDPTLEWTGYPTDTFEYLGSHTIGDGDSTDPVTKVEDVTASPESGTLFPGDTVELSTSTEGATIYFTTDESDPTSESEMYVDPITIEVDTVIKAIAVKDGLEDSVISTFTYTVADPSEVISIDSIKVVNENGELIQSGTYTIEGIVTVDQGTLTNSRTDFYIQDSTGGINIFNYESSIGSGIKAGDLVKITGELDQYNGLAELVPTSEGNIEVISTGNELPQPVEATVEELNTFSNGEKLEGSLASTQGVLTSIGTNSIIEDDKGNTFTIRVANGQASWDDFKVGDRVKVTGIVSQYDSSSPYTSGYQIFPRSQNDLVKITSLSINHTPVEEHYAGIDLSIEAEVEEAEEVTLYYRETGTIDFLSKGMTLESGHYQATILADELSENGLDYYIEASNGDESVTSGTADAPHHVEIIQDTEGPEFFFASPIDGMKTEDQRPEISVEVNDPSGINEASILMSINGEAVTPVYYDEHISYQPESSLDYGIYTVVVSAEDQKGNRNETSWGFEVIEPFAGGEHYVGTTHNHTKFSHDGAGDPEEALAAAQKYNYDWFAFSDHSHDIDSDLVDQDTVDHDGMPEREGGEEWATTKALADEYTVDGEFVVFPAFEMTSTTWGHSNIFGTENFIDRKMADGLYQDLSKFYAWVLTYDDLVAQFNHPTWPGGAFGNFVPYDQELDKLFTMLEVGNGSGHYSYENAEEQFFNALDLGWKIAPTYGEDNHDASWGQTLKRTVIVSEDLTQDSLLHSMRNLRVYMAEDPNFTLDVMANGRYMGSTVDSQEINFDIRGQDLVNESADSSYDYLSSDYQSDDRVEKVELITNGAQIIDSISPMTESFDWNPTVNVTGQQWFVIKVTQMDGEQIYSSPIWSKAVPYDVKISGIGMVNDAAIAGTPVTFEAGLTNLGTEDVTDVKVTFYVDEESEENIIGETTVADLPSNGTAKASVVWESPTSGDHIIIATINQIGSDATEDNRFEKQLEVKEPLGITVMIDASHNNENTTTDTGSYDDNLNAFTSILRNEGYTVVENEEALSDEVLEEADILFMTHPLEDLTTEENEAVATFVEEGGSLALMDRSNYKSDPTVNNDLLQEIGSTIQFNDDGIYDNSEEGNFWSNPLSAKHAVRLYPETVDNYITDRVGPIDYYSGSSLFKVGGEPLINSDTVTILAFGNETTYQNYLQDGFVEYHTDADSLGGDIIPAIAVEEIGDGKLFVSGMNVFNDKQLDESYDEKGNDELALQVINWLADRGTELTDIQEAREMADGTEVVVEGIVTSDSNTFFDAFYLQDETGGIMAYKELPTDTLQLGDRVRVYGHITEFEGNLELEFDDFEVDVIKVSEEEPLLPTEVSTGDASSMIYQGMLIEVTGEVVDQYDENSYIVNDGSGEILIFTDGYIVESKGELPEIQIGDTLTAVGLAGTFSDGHRIRVRDTNELSVKPYHDEVVQENHTVRIVKRYYRDGSFEVLLFFNEEKFGDKKPGKKK